MSRQNVARSRADKTGKVSSAPTPAITQEIVPGKFNDHDWNLMTDHDEGDEFVVSIVEEICESAIDIIYKQYIDDQLVPYTVTQAKDAILQIIEWQFLARDEGEEQVEADAGWFEDEEPEPCVTDCWAQGSVPRQVSSHTPRGVKFEDQLTEEQQMASIAEVEGEESTVEQAKAEHDQTPVGTPEVAPELDESEEVTQEEEQVTSRPPSEAQVPQPPTPEVQEDKPKKRFKFKPYRGKLKSAGTSKMTESLEEFEMQMAMKYATTVDARSPDLAMLQMPSSCHSIIKLQAGRPPANRDIIYDEYGNVVSVTKINPDKLPSHRVKTVFSIVDPETEAAQARLEAMRTGRYQSNGPKASTTTSSKAGWSTMSRSDKSESRTQGTTHKTTSTHSTKGPLPPPLIEAMEVAAGVTVKEGERVKKGPRQHPKRTEQHQSSSQSLKPIAVRAKVPVVTVSELLEHQVPVIRPIRESPVVPPINGSYQQAVSSR